MRIGTIELLRGLAALSVAIAHSDSLIGGNADLPFGRWHSFAMPGTAGVEFFFVLSGFVMAVAHRQDLAQGGRIGRFLWRRFCRIYPLYWFVLAFPLWRFWGAPLLTPDAILAWLSLLPIRGDNLLVVAWTLRQEVTFYLMLSLCLIPRIGRFVLGAWIAATIVWWFVLPAPPTPPVGALLLSHVLSIFNFEFFAGLLAGWLLPRLLAIPGKTAAAVGWALLAGGITGVAWRMSIDGWGVHYGPTAARPQYGAAYAAVILGCAALERSGRIRFNALGASLAAAAGAISYPLYLSHLITLDYVAHLIGPAGFAARIGPDLTFVVLLLSAVAVAGAVSFLIDRPIQRLLRRISAGNTSRQPALG